MSFAVLDQAPALRTQTSSRKTVWLQVLSHLDRSFGGLTAVVPALTQQLLEREAQSVQLAAFCTPQEHFDTTRLSPAPSIWPAKQTAWWIEAQLRERFGRLVEGCDGVHVHGLWDTSSAVAVRAALKHKKPYVVSAHGMLEPWALAQKAWKKKIYSALVERPALQKAACLHALTLAEAEDYRRFGCSQPIAVIPNAVAAPERIDPKQIDKHVPSAQGRRVVLFLGRLHVKKGIELLLQAWAGVCQEFPDALLLLAGPGEPAYVQQLQHATEQLGIQERTVFAGMLNEGLKWSALQQAHVFVLPSYSEGLSVAALESLAAGTPAIVTDACHLPEIAATGSGWEIAPNVSALAVALRTSLEATAEQRRTMSVNAQHLAATQFSWQVVCERFAELYDCVLSGERPSHSPYWEATR